MPPTLDPQLLPAQLCLARPENLGACNDIGPTTRRFGWILMPLFLLLVSIGVSNQTWAQQIGGNIIIKGVVKDSVTYEAMPFVNIILEGSQKGTSTDLNGAFVLSLSQLPARIKLSYVGYYPKTIEVNSVTDILKIKLVPSVIEKVAIVVLKNANPAHRIIKLAVKNKPKNNPENITSFTYRSHNKFIVNPVSISPRNRPKEDRATIERREDSLLAIKSPGAKLIRDSTYYAKARKREIRDSIDREEFSKHLDTSYLFLNETFTERKYRYPNQSNETVISTRTSGFPKLALAAIGTRLQPFGMYKDAITLFNRDYISPISAGSTRRYDFTLVQTRVNAEGDTTFVINYVPYDDANINGLKGQVSINSKGYAIQNITARSADDVPLIDFSIKQMYEIVDGKYWFPTQLHTDFNFGGAAKANDEGVVGIARTYIGGIKTDAGLRRMDFIEEELEIPEISTNLPIAEMNKLRIDTASLKEANTYKFMDKIIKDSASKAEKIVMAMEYLALGAIPIGKFELPLDQFFTVNKFEGFRFGSGIRTNQRLSKHWVFGGYGAYGTKDGRFKYNLFADYKFSRFFDWHINLAYTNDVSEPGQQSFLNFKNLLSTEGYRTFITSRMDYFESWRLSTRLRPFKFTGLEFGIDRRLVGAGYDYQFGVDDTQGTDANLSAQFSGFRTLEAQASLSIVYGERYELFKGRRIMLDRGYPAIYLQASRGIRNNIWGDLDYVRLNARVEHHIKSIFIGNTYITLAGGYTDRPLPYGLLFNGMGAKDRDIPVAMRNYFQTVGTYEFTQDQFAALFFYHDFGSLLWRSKYENFAPKPALVHAMGWGDLRRPELQLGINNQSMNKGLYETGILVKDMYRIKYLNTYYLGFGVGAFYRYGPLQLPGQWDNMVFKLDTEISF